MKRTILIFILGMCIASLASAFEYEEVKELLADEEGGEIEYLSKINLGISGGENWIATRGEYDEFGWIYMYIYTIDSEKKVRIVDSSQIPKQSKVKYIEVDLEFDIMENIPGTRIGNNAAAFGDYNWDGLDELFVFFPVYPDRYCAICGYDETGKEKIYFRAGYSISSPQGPPPVEFTNYQGIDGFKIIIWDYYGKDDKRYYWAFCAWDERSREYEKITDSEKEGINYYKVDVPVTPKTVGNAEEINIPLTNNNDGQQEAVQNNDGTSSPPLWAWLAIIGGTVVVVSGVVLLMVKRKK